MKPRVLQLIGNLHPAGSERQAAQLAAMLHKSSRYEVSVACLDPRGKLGEELRQAGLGDIPAFQMTNFYNRGAAIQLKRFIRFLRDRRIDIVQTHDFYTNVFGIVGARLAGVPVRIAAKRETEVGWRTPMQKRVERMVYRFANAIVVNAEAVREHLIDQGVNAEKIVVVYNSLELGRVTPLQGREEILAMFNLPPDGDSRFVTILANLAQSVKDHPMFLRAAQIVRDSVPEARFVLAGEGGLTEPMRSLAKGLGLEKDVFFTGRCEHVAELLSISDVCVLSSMAEGFSNSILEYMGASRPVVVTDVGGAREAVIEGKTGYIVNSGDYRAMAMRITNLLREPEQAREMGRRGRSVVEEKFSTETQLARIEQLYRLLLLSAHSPAAEFVEASEKESTESIEAPCPRG